MAFLAKDAHAKSLGIFKEGWVRCSNASLWCSLVLCTASLWCCVLLHCGALQCFTLVASSFPQFVGHRQGRGTAPLPSYHFILVCCSPQGCLLDALLVCAALLRMHGVVRGGGGAGGCQLARRARRARPQQRCGLNPVQCTIVWKEAGACPSPLPSNPNPHPTPQLCTPATPPRMHSHWPTHSQV